jgi:LPXTG-motif cell wall-anchored protein
MKNVLIIAGSLALIGGGVYFYSKKKKEEQKVNKLQALTEPTPIPTTPTTTVNSELSPLSVAYGDDQIKLQKAKEYVKKYVSLSKVGAVGEKNAFKVLNAKLKKIGYAYKDGLLKKI